MSKQIFGFERSEDSAGFLLWQTTVTWQRLIKKALDPYAISHAQFVILAVALWLENKNQETSQVAIIHLRRNLIFFHQVINYFYSWYPLPIMLKQKN